MNIDTMRNIDYYVGVPLCWIFSKVDSLYNLIFRPKPSKSAKVLFIELSEMGSAILADPCMRHVQAKGNEIFFLIFKKNAASLRLLNTVPAENIFVLREHRFILLLWDALRFVFWCRARKIDSVIDLELFSRVTALLTWASFAANKVGFHKYHQEGLYRGEFFTHRVPYNHSVHIVHNFMNLAESLIEGMSADGFHKRPLLPSDLKVTQVVVSDSQREAVRERLKTFVPSWTPESQIYLINANAGDFLPQRKWPKEYFVKLILGILQKDPRNLALMTGAPSERESNDWIVKQVMHERCLNFAGCVSFEQLPVLYAVSKVLITNDSGPAHFSSITNVRSYVIFGPETPALYGSLGNSTSIYANYSCSPCVSATNHRKTHCSDNQCLKAIKPDHILDLL